MFPAPVILSWKCTVQDLKQLTFHHYNELIFLPYGRSTLFLSKTALILKNFIIGGQIYFQSRTDLKIK